MGALTLARLRSHVTNALQGGSVPSELQVSSQPDEIINDAARFMFSAHQWNFRVRSPITLTFHSNQGYVPLPHDFQEMVAYQMTSGLNYGIEWTTPQEILVLRSTTVTVTQNFYWGAIMFPEQTARSQPPPPPRIELWPEPSSDNVDALTLVYRAKWMDLINSTDVADVPEYAEAALIQCVRGFARGYSERLMEPKGGLDAILGAVLGGAIWRMAITTDGLVQSDYGETRWGAIQSKYPMFSWRSASASPVADPS